MTSIFIIKADRVLLTRRYDDECWQASCTGAGDPDDVLFRELSITTRLVRCAQDVYRGVTSDLIATTHEVDEIEWVRIEDLSRFVSQNRCDSGLVPALNALLESLGSSLRITL
ncbi:MAG: hypothetical protein ACMXYM_00255 [Candidatus Woesearchaeota archaeon]